MVENTNARVRAGARAAGGQAYRGHSTALAAAIEAALDGRGARRTGDEITFRCPAHDDRNPSASWNRAKGAWHCFRCGAKGGALDLAQRLGIETGAGAVGVADGLTVAALAEAKRLAETFLRSLGVRDGKRFGAPCVVVPYCDERGDMRGERRRLALTGARFEWRRGANVTPYGMDRLADARATGSLLLVEGESDAWTCWNARIPALGVPGAATWRDEWAAHLLGIGNVAVWREPDAGGDTLAAKVAASLPDVRIIDAPADAKDPSALWIALDGDADAFRARMAELAQSAPVASAMRAEALTRESRDAYDAGRAILDADDPLAEVERAIRALGYAGDTMPPMLAYLALTSRLLSRPMNLAYVAASASGKTFAVDTALRLMPASAYHLLKAGSPRALIYDDDADYRHKVVIIGEADSIPEDGPAASAIRSIASDNEMRYDVVERDERTGAHATRHIVKPGPTGLITTSTRALSPQLDTRSLTISVPDTPAYTRAVLEAIAARADGTAPAMFDCTPFQAAQRWLELAGVRDVVIPFARRLMIAVPDAGVRMRRDGDQLMTAIAAVALLRQRGRARDPEGRIIAEPADYETARTLLLGVFDTAATGGVSATVRETAETVAALVVAGAETVTVQQLADALRLDKASASRRWQRAAKLGYVINRETRKGQPAQLVPGDPLPADTPALPEAAMLCVGHPGTGATVQPLAGASFDAESTGTVAALDATATQPLRNRPSPSGPAPAVAPAVAGVLQPSVQPFEADDSNTEAGRDVGAVARLHAKPEGLDMLRAKPSRRLSN